MILLCVCQKYLFLDLWYLYKDINLHYFNWIYFVEAHLSKDPAQEVVVSRERVSHQHLCSGAGIQQAFIGRLEEPLVGVKARLQQLIEKLTKYATTIDACLIQTVSVQ